MSDFMIENGILKEYVGPGGDVVVPDGVVELGYAAFSEARYYGTECPNAVISITLPEGVTTIGSNAFAMCQELKKVVLPQSLKQIGSYAFYECSELTELVIPEGVTDIADRAFAGCKKLDIVIPPNIKVIEEAAFRGCNLSSIVIHEGITKIGKDAFKNCSKIKTAGPIGGGYQYQFPWTTEIPDNAFSGLSKLKTAVLPASIKKVGGNAFNGCKALTDLTMPKDAKVHKTAFKGCDKLVDIKEPVAEAVVLNEVQETRKDSDFLITNGRLVEYRGNNEEIMIPDDVTVIGKRAFYSKSSIRSVTIPASVTSIEQEAFCYCNNLETICIQGSLEKVGAQAFGWLRNDTVEAQVYKNIPVRIFSKSEFCGQDAAVNYFCRCLAEFDTASAVYQDNIKYIGSHLKQTTKIGKQSYVMELVKSAALRHALFEADAIPAKDIDWAVTTLQEYPEIVAELLDYKNRILADPKVKKSLEKSEERAMEKAFSAEMSAADWRKLFKFSYEDGDVVIKENKSTEPDITVPARIGSKNVRAIDRHAFSFRGDLQSPKTIVVSEGIQEIRKGAFLLVEDCEIFLPSTVTSLPRGCFVAVHNLTLHLTAGTTEIDKEMEFDSLDPAIKLICAPAGSYAETYAKENNIPFSEE